MLLNMLRKIISIILKRVKLKYEVSTAWKVFKYGVISGPYFPVSGLNTERYGVSLSKCIQIKS